MAFSMAGGGPSRPEINVTPLIDILLVLIIVFMVIVATSKEYMVEAQIPQPAGEHPPENERTIVIQVVWNAQSGGPTVRINGDDVSWDDLRPRLARIFLKRAEKVVYVKGDESLDYEFVAQVIAEAHNAGVERVGLLTTP